MNTESSNNDFTRGSCCESMDLITGDHTLPLGRDKCPTSVQFCACVYVFLCV